MFYDRYVFLCQLSGKSPSRVAIEAGINKGSASVWKKKYEMGEFILPSSESLLALSKYFNVSIDYLLGNDDKKNNTFDISAEDVEILRSIISLSEDKKKLALDYLKLLHHS